MTLHPEHFVLALEYMAKGMAEILGVMIVMILAVGILKKEGKNDASKPEKKE